MKKAKLTKPTNLQLIKGYLISIAQVLLRGYVSSSMLQKVGKYKLVKPISKENLIRAFAIGVYSYKGKKFFIKTWQGKLNNFAYYSLSNEYIASEVIYRKLEEQSVTKGFRVKIPKPIEYISTKNSLSLVYEYVEGRTLTNFSKKKKVAVISKVLKNLHNISKDLKEEEQSLLTKRNAFSYFTSILPFSIITLASNPGSFKAVLRALITCISSFRHLDKSRLCLAHRDINRHNILVSKKGIYLIDLERLVLTVPNYDITYLSLDPKLEGVAELVQKRLNLKPNRFLKNYILLHFSNSIGNPKNFKNLYLTKLYQVNA